MCGLMAKRTFDSAQGRARGELFALRGEEAAGHLGCYEAVFDGRRSGQPNSGDVVQGQSEGNLHLFVKPMQLRQTTGVPPKSKRKVRLIGRAPPDGSECPWLTACLVPIKRLPALDWHTGAAIRRDQVMLAPDQPARVFFCKSEVAPLEGTPPSPVGIIPRWVVWRFEALNCPTTCG